MRVVIAGGSGFVGSRLVPLLRGRGHDVVCYDLVVNPPLADITIQGDVRDAAAYSAACQGADAIINLAAAHRDDVKPISLYQQTNVDGATNTVRASVDNGIGTILFVSSVAVYGLDEGESRETDTPHPFNEYGRTKLEAEGVYRAWQREDETRRLVIVRPCVIFGEGNRGNVYTLARQIRTGVFLTVGDGSNRKSMAYVGNVATYLAGRLESTEGPDLVNYADKPDLTTNELVSVLRGAFGRQRGQSVHVPLGLGVAGGRVFDGLALLLRRPLPISSVRVRKFAASTVVNTERLEASGFTRQVTIEEGLRRTVHHEFGGAL